ncbi:hypothetical protein [Planobispora rosea]|nr:hypothetical protein [Planobispora rosea]
MTVREDLSERAENLLKQRLPTARAVDEIDQKIADRLRELTELIKERPRVYARALRDGWGKEDLEALGIPEEVKVTIDGMSGTRRPRRSRSEKAAPAATGPALATGVDATPEPTAQQNGHEPVPDADRPW